MQSVYFATAWRLKICWWMAEPRYQMGHMKHETEQNIFRHIQTKEWVYICEASELTERQCVVKLKQNGWWGGR